MSRSVILSEAKNLSWFLLLKLIRREILRFAQNDGFLSLSAACKAVPQKEFLVRQSVWSLTGRVIDECS